VLPSSKAAADSTTGRRRRTTLAAIAAEAGVSLPTVSKVVNGRRDVAPATRALVERLLDEHHYTRAGTRRNRRSGLVDLVFNGLDSPWAVEILRGVEEWGTVHETGVAVSAVRHGNARPASWTSGLASHDTDGVPDPPSAVFAGSGQQAFGLYEAARQRGLRVPQDLSIVGFDDLPVARWVSPPLTTVRQPLAEMGRAAAQMLDDLIDGLPLRTNRVELSTELIVRESTAPPGAAGS